MCSFKSLVLYSLAVLFNVGHPSIVKVPVPVPSLAHATLGENWKQSRDDAFICFRIEDGKPGESYMILGLLEVDPASEIHLEARYKMKECSSYRKCSYSFDVLALGTDETDQLDRKDLRQRLVKVAELTNTSVMEKGREKIFSSTVRIGTNGRKGLNIGFTTSGACGRFLSIDVWYITCPTAAGQLMNFPLKPAPNSSVSVLRIQGRCMQKSVAVTSDIDNYMSCHANGTTEVHGGCHCKAGYFMEGSRRCKDCLAKTYKPIDGNGLCLQCTKNVKDGLLPRKTICQCLDGYFRPVFAIDNFKAECEAPPSPPTTLNASSVSSEWTVITWAKPEKAGTGGPISYEIHCEQCDVKVRLTSQLSYNLTRLKPYTFYNITIFAENNVTSVIDTSNYDKLYFKTLSGLPSAVRGLKAIRNVDGSVTITWNSPAAKGGPDLVYHIVINGKNGFYSKGSNYSLLRQEKRHQYTISIRSHTGAGFSDAQSISFAVEGKAKGIPLTTGIAVGITFAIIFIAAVICIIVFYRRRHPSHLQTVRLENGTVKLPKGQRVYVEPTTYQDVADAVREFAKELERDWIKLETVIGGGEFGDVYRGILRRPLEDDLVVAIKTLKGNASKEASDDFLSEAAYMGQFDDPNVIALEGVIVRDKPILIVTEYMSNGSLDTYLQENDSRFSSLQLLGMARGVSSGMTYLSEISFIHRDLAARNILVNDNVVCKVADFGMSRELSDDDAYNTTGGKIPVRWTSPEVIQYKKFTSASDVWSYGILLWEIMSYGERPYWDWGNYEVVERLTSGYRLPPPMGCPKVVHDLMLSCWQKDRIKRPKFREVRNTIDKWIRNPELLMQEASVVTKRDEDLDYASMSTLTEWLDSIRMGQYAENFERKNLVTPRQILDLTEEDLKHIGVLAVGHRMKIMKSINATKNQLLDDSHGEDTTAC